LVGEGGEQAQIAVWWGLGAIRDALVRAGFSLQEEHVTLPPKGTWPPTRTKL
jgi:hypothetical protein